MKKKLFFKKLSLMIFIFALMGGLYAIFGIKSMAGTNVPPVPYNVRIQHSPNGGSFVNANGSSVTLNLSPGENTRSIKLINKATDANGNKVGTQVMYRKSTESFWHSFGSRVSTDPENHHPINTPVSACQVDIGPNHPKCGSYPNGITSGYNEYGWKLNLTQNTEITNAAINLGPGTWIWRTRALDYYDSSGHTSYSTNWSSAFSITINASSSVTPTPEPEPEPEPTPEPEPELEPLVDEIYNDDALDYSYLSEDESSESYSEETPTDEEIVEQDTEPPTKPADLRAEYDNTKSGISLTWGASTDDSSALYYEIERSIVNEWKWEVIETTDYNEYVDYEFEPKKYYAYRIRAFDDSDNKSEYSDQYKIMAGSIETNYKAGEEADVSSDDKNLTIHFPSNTSREDLLIVIEKVDPKQISVEKNKKLASDVYSIKARNVNGDEINNFKTQISIYLKATAIGSSNIQTIKMGYMLEDDNIINVLKTKINSNNKTGMILTDHLSLYFLISDKTSALAIFIRIILWLIIIGLIIGGGYYGYLYLQRKKYREEHSEDYIYRH